MSWVRYGSFDDDKYIDDNALLVAYLISEAVSELNKVDKRDNISFSPHRYYIPPTWSAGDMVCLMYELAKEYGFSINSVETNPSELSDTYIKIREKPVLPEFERTPLSDWMSSFIKENSEKTAKVLSRFANNKMDHSDLSFLIEGKNWENQKLREAEKSNLMKVRNTLLDHVKFSGSPQEGSKNLERDIAQYAKKFSNDNLSLDWTEWRYKSFEYQYNYKGEVYSYKKHIRRIMLEIERTKAGKHVEVSNPEGEHLPSKQTDSDREDAYNATKLLFVHTMLSLEIYDLIDIKRYHNNWSADSQSTRHTFEVEIKEDFNDKYNYQRHKDAGESKSTLRIPSGTKWENFILNFKNKHNVEIRLKGQKEIVNYREMNFQDGRTGKPNQQWELLLLLSENNGELEYGDPDAKDNFKKQKQLLKDRLQDYFDIDYDPFYPYQQNNSYNIKMTLSPPDNQKDDEEKGTEQILDPSQ